MPDTPEEKRRRKRRFRRVGLRIGPYAAGFWVSLIWCMVALEEMSFQIERPVEWRFHALQWGWGTCPMLLGLWLVRRLISRFALKSILFLAVIPLAASATVQYYHTRYLWHPSYGFPIANGVLAVIMLLLSLFVRKEETIKF
ncbi:MAG: hypothetical protein IT210_07565 [Armatimonadetes bacterium]|nr:hypothetical protein [Armatimonadota bacterium]